MVEPSKHNSTSDGPATETVVPSPNMAQSRAAPSGTSLGEVYDPALNSWQPVQVQSRHDRSW